MAEPHFLERLKNAPPDVVTAAPGLPLAACIGRGSATASAAPAADEFLALRTAADVALDRHHLAGPAGVGRQAAAGLPVACEIAGAQHLAVTFQVEGLLGRGLEGPPARQGRPYGQSRCGSC